MTRSRHRALAPAVLGLVLAWACVTSPGGSEPEEHAEDRLLETLMESFVSGRLAFYPAESTLAGLLANDHRLGTFARRDVEGRIAWLSDFRLRLTGLRLSALSRPAYMDALWLSSLAKSELFELEERARWRHTASFYAEPVALGVASLLAADDLPSRTGALLDRLDAVASLVEQARENLGPTHELFRLDGLDALSRCRALVLAVPALVSARVDASTAARIGEASERAASELERLFDELPRLQGGADSVGEPVDNPAAERAAVPGPALGAERLEGYFRHRHMSDWSLAELTSRASRAAQRAADELTELALERAPGLALTELLAAGPAPDPRASAIAAEERARSFVREHLSLQSPADPLPVRLAPRYFPGREPVALFRLNALEPERGSFLLVREGTRIGEGEIELLALKEGLGGRLQNRQQAGSASLLRRVMRTESTSLAWRGWLERSAVGAGYGASPDVAILHRWRRLLDALRLEAVIRFHAGGDSLGDLATLFRDRGYLPDEAARRQARLAAIEPAVADAALGELLLAELVADYLGRLPLTGPERLRERILRSGPLPIRLLRFDYLEPDRASSAATVHGPRTARR